MKVVETGRNAILVCEATGDPKVNIYWVKDSLRLQPNPRYSVLDKGKLRGEREHTDKLMRTKLCLLKYGKSREVLKEYSNVYVLYRVVALFPYTILKSVTQQRLKKQPYTRKHSVYTQHEHTHQ